MTDPKVPSAGDSDVTQPLGAPERNDGDGDGDDCADVESMLGDICPGCGDDATGR